MYESPLFFVHVMKTAGGTFRRHLRHLVPPEATYPTPEHDPMFTANLEIPLMLDQPLERLRAIRVFAGHFPAVACDLLAERIGVRPVTLTVLRDPVERTLSFLKMREGGGKFSGWPLERIYDDHFVFKWFVHNHQTRLFSLTAADRPESFMVRTAIDHARWERACATIDEFDVLGTTESFGDFCDLVSQRTGWRFTSLPDAHVSKGQWEVSETFRSRIAEDNALDVALYEHACRTIASKAPTVPAAESD